jgi:ankyrin repeat protein
MYASMYGHLEVVKWLLQNGANINDKVRDGSKNKRERKKDE